MRKGLLPFAGQLSFHFGSMSFLRRSIVPTSRSYADSSGWTPAAAPPLEVSANDREQLPVSLYENTSARTNRLAPGAQREPIEEQEDLHCASIHTSLPENQKAPRYLAGSRVQSEQAEAVIYSVVKSKRPNAVPGESDQTETAETSALYSAVKKNLRY
ncbi:unnamed protein product [Gadus morhua 'NCC']